MKSFATLLVISSIAFLALSQNAVPTGFVLTTCALTATGTGSVATVPICTQCNSGFALTNNQTTACSLACPVGCLICNSSSTGQCFAAGCRSAAGQGWAYNALAGMCVDCSGAYNTSQGSAVTGVTLGCTTCTLTTATLASSVVSCTACASGYVISSGYCVSCSNTTAQTSGASATLTGIAQCTACSATPATASVSTKYVACSNCAAGYGLLAVAAAAASNGTATTAVAFTTTSQNTKFSVLTPQCLSLSASTVATVLTGATQATYATPTADSWGNTLYMGAGAAVGTQITGCGYGTFGWYVPVTNAAGDQTLIYQCTQPLIGTTNYYCIVQGTLPIYAACSTAWPTGGTGTLASITNCNSATIAVTGLTGVTATGINTVTTAGTVTGATYSTVTCTACATGFNLVSNACVNNTVTGCIAASVVSSSTCTAAAQGYHISGSTFLSANATTAVAPTLCTNITTACSGGCAATQYLAWNGTCQTGTPITGCTIQNGTNCIQCGAIGGASTAWYGLTGTVTPNTTCTACPTGCSYCSASATANCTICQAGYSLTSAMQCASSASSSAKASSMLLSGLAFISMIFYYIF